MWLRVVAGLQTCVIPQMFKLGWELVLGPEGDCTAVQSYFAVLPPFVDGEDARKPKLSKTESFSTSPSAIAYVEVLHMLVWSWWVVFGGWWHSPRCALSRRSSRDECAWAWVDPLLPPLRPASALPGFNKEMLNCAVADIAAELFRMFSSGGDISIEFRCGRFVVKSGECRFYVASRLQSRVIAVRGTHVCW